MTEAYSSDPRSIRTRKAFQRAFKELLQETPFESISVTDIAQRAGYARHTFYNHYGAKIDILNHLIDTVLEEFFSGLGKWDFNLADPQKELRMYTSFFQAWKDNFEIVAILNKTDFELLLLERLEAFFTRYYYERITKEIPGVSVEFAKYVINFNAYTLLGILKPWLQDGMRHPPEVMAGFLMQLTGSSQRRQAVERFKGIIR